LTVVHATEPTPEQQGVGFDRAFEWDVPLTEGYRSLTVRPPVAEDRVGSSTFTGLDVPEISRAIADTNPDVVMINGWYSVTLVRALIACRRLGIPTLYRGDSHLLSGPRNWKRPLWSLKTGFLLRQFDGFLSPGQRVNEYLRWYARPGTPRSSACRMPWTNEMFAASAAPFQRAEVRARRGGDFGIAPDAFVPLFVGKLVPSKRPTNIVRAAARLERGASVVFVGSVRSRRVAPGSRRARRRSETHRILNQTELGEGVRHRRLSWCCRATNRKPGVWSSMKRSPPVCPASSAMPLAAPPT
jgi:glycosyltransferase involved in cell wall biosynthesis